MINFSVIIPHKNCPELLKRCIDSVPLREDIEVIAVDDNSSCIDRLKELESQYSGSNVKFVYTTEGKGAGYARNIGLCNATGKWLLFADADDYFTKDAFKIFEEYLDTKADVVVFKHRAVMSDTGERTQRSEYRNQFVDNYVTNPCSVNETMLRLRTAVPWAKMVRSSLVAANNIKFDEVPASNDAYFSLLAGYNANSILADQREVYCATVRDGSITKSRSVERYFSDHCVSLRINKFVRDIGHPECQLRLLSRLFLILRKFGISEFIRFMREVRRYDGKLFFGLSSNIKQLFSLRR